MSADKALDIKQKDFYIKIPKSVAIHSGLNDTDCYVFGALNSYANIPSYKSKGIPLYTTKIADKLGIQVRVLLYTINNLISQGLIRVSYDEKIKRRRIFLNVHHDDAYVLIPHEVVASDISIQSKIFYGKAFASRNGYAYENIRELAEYTDKHKSSVYRHVSLLEERGFLKRDKSNLYRWLPNDAYSARKRVQKASTKDKVYSTGERASKRLAKAPPTNIQDHVMQDESDKALDEIYRSIR